MIKVTKIPKENNIFFYVIKRELLVNEKQVIALNLAEFENDAENLRIEAQNYNIFLFAHAAPLNEPAVARGTFVMSRKAEIHQAYKD